MLFDPRSAEGSADLVARGVEFVVAGVKHVVHVEREVVLSAGAWPRWLAVYLFYFILFVLTRRGGVGWAGTGTLQTPQLLELSGESEAGRGVQRRDG